MRIVKVVDFSRAAEESRMRRMMWKYQQQRFNELSARAEKLKEEFRQLIEVAEKKGKVEFLALKAGNSPLSSKLLRELTYALESISPKEE